MCSSMCIPLCPATMVTCRAPTSIRLTSSRLAISQPKPSMTSKRVVMSSTLVWVTMTLSHRSSCRPTSTTTCICVSRCKNIIVRNIQRLPRRKRRILSTSWTCSSGSVHWRKSLARVECNSRRRARLTSTWVSRATKPTTLPCRSSRGAKPTLTLTSRFKPLFKRRWATR